MSRYFYIPLNFLNFRNIYIPLNFLNFRKIYIPSNSCGYRGKNMKTRIVFGNTNIDRETLVGDLERVYIEQNDVESFNDVELQEAWVRHGIHAGTWSWERIHTDISAPTWGWVVVNEGDVREIECEISALREQVPDQVFSSERIQDYLSDLEQGMQRLQGRKMWVAQDEDGYHLGFPAP